MNRKQITLCVALAIIAFSTLTALGQTPDEPKEEAKPLVVVEPHRKCQFKVLDEPLEKPLIRADPKLLEQKFVAVVSIVVRGPGNSGVGRAIAESAGTTELIPGAGISLISGRGVSSSGFYSRRGGGGDRSGVVLDHFTALLAAVPKEKRPPEEFLRTFLERLGEGYLWIQLSNIDNRNSVQFSLLADSEEQAKRQAEALLTIIDYGICMQAQTKIVAARHEVDKQLRDTEKQLAEEQKKLDALTKSLADAPTIDAQAVSDFRIRQHLLSVELAGTRARLETINQLLAGDRKLNESRIDRLEDLKITAEVELAGLAAQKKALAELIVMGEKRSKLSNEGKAVSVRVKNLRSGIRQFTSEISTLGQAFEMLAPLPLFEDQVIIRPIKWTSGEG